jgi:hypothetical protein
MKERRRDLASTSSTGSPGIPNARILDRGLPRLVFFPRRVVAFPAVSVRMNWSDDSSKDSLAQLGGLSKCKPARSNTTCGVSPCRLFLFPPATCASGVRESCSMPSILSDYTPLRILIADSCPRAGQPKTVVGPPTPEGRVKEVLHLPAHEKGWSEHAMDLGNLGACSDHFFDPRWEGSRCLPSRLILNLQAGTSHDSS